MLPVATWNVLHRIHAVNWSEPAIAAHVDENVRIAAIARRVNQLATRDGCVVALQEVSGDQLEAVRETASAHHVVAAPYPRVPAYYRPEQRSTWPRDPTEFLVVVVPRAANLKVTATRSHAFDNDRGKGFLAVQLDNGMLVVATHTSWGDKATPQLADLAAGVRAHGGPAIVMGDFNADRETVIERLGPDFIAGVPPAGLSTRPRAEPSAKSEDIDHVIARRGSLRDVFVASANGLSDHNIVRALFAPTITES